MRRVALAVAFLLAGCSSSSETRTLFVEADGGVTENPVVEADSGGDAGQDADARKPEPRDCSDAATCLLSAPFHCVTQDGACGCSWKTDRLPYCE